MKTLWAVLCAVPLLVAGTAAEARPGATADHPVLRADPDHLVAVRELVNGSFEDPPVASLDFWRDPATSTGYPGAKGLFAYGSPGVPKAVGMNGDDGPGLVRIPGWQSTQPEETEPEKWPRAAIEIWRQNTNDADIARQSRAADGEYFAELNAGANAALFQDLCVLRGETIRWSVEHKFRGRRTVSASYNSMYVSISRPDSWEGITPPTHVTQGEVFPDLRVSPDASGAWTRHSGTWTDTSGSGTWRFAFGASNPPGYSQTSGNFIDDVVVSLPPIFGFRYPFVADEAGTPVVGPVRPGTTVYPVFVANGLVTAPATVTCGYRGSVPAGSLAPGPLASGTGGPTAAPAGEQADGGMTITVPPGH